MQFSDEELVAKIQNGDKQAFANLVTKYHKKYYRVAYRYLFNKNEAEDVVQTAFMKLWECPFQWQLIQGIKFSTWFYRVIINLALDKNKKKTEVYTDTLEYFESKQQEDKYQESKNESKYEHRLEQQVNHEIIKQAISDLPKRQQTALNLCFYEQLSNKEAAKIMKTTVSAVQSLLIRAKRSLHKNISDKVNNI